MNVFSVAVDVELAQPMERGVAIHMHTGLAPAPAETPRRILVNHDRVPEGPAVFTPDIARQALDTSREIEKIMHRHTRDDFVRSPATPSNICYSYLNTGTCSFGDKCKYSHKESDLKAHAAHNLSKLPEYNRAGTPARISHLRDLEMEEEEEG